MVLYAGAASPDTFTPPHFTTPLPPTALQQHLERLALWRITPPHPTTTPHDAFPPTHGACATPANRPLIRGVSSVLTGGSAGPAPPPSTAKRHTLRQPDGMLSPAAFSPFPRAAAGVVGALANGGALLLPSKEGPCVCRRVWEQAMSKGVWGWWSALVCWRCKTMIL